MATNNQEQTKATINFVADVLKKSPNPALREASKQMRAQSNLSDAITLAEEAATSTNPNNSLVGNLAVLVGEQWVETQSADIYGNFCNQWIPDHCYLRTFSSRWLSGLFQDI